MSADKEYIVPGEYRLLPDDIEINVGRRKLTMRVANKGDRPVQVGSHIHFAEVNAEMDFDRKAAIGMRLDIPSGTAIRFEPGQETEVELVEIGGEHQIYGVANMVDGSVDKVDEIIKKIQDNGYQGAE